MSQFSSFTMALGMIAAFLLAAGGVRLILNPQTRSRGVLMLVVALVLVTNVMIWTV